MRVKNLPKFSLVRIVVDSLSLLSVFSIIKLEIHLILRTILIEKKFIKNFEFKHDIIIKLLLIIIKKELNIIDDNDGIE